MQQLSQSLAENLSALDARFGQSADYYAKKIVLYGCPGCIVMFDGMASLDSLWELLLDAAGRQSASVRLTGTQAYAHILHGSAFPAESTPVQDMSQLVARLTAGMAVLLLEGCSSGIVFSVQGLKFRSVEEPSAEGNLRGSREGFTDLLRVNLSLLRRLVRTDTLMQEAAQAHTCCNTGFGNNFEQHDVACVCHMSTTAEFLGEVAHGYHTYLLIIFLSEQSHCSGFLSLFHIHNICTDFKTSLDFFINKRFYLCDLIS